MFGPRCACSPVSSYLSMKQIDKVQIKFAGGATPAVIKIARHNLLHATYFTLVCCRYWTSDREKRESFHCLTRSNNVIIWHMYCPPTQTPTLVTMGLIMTLTMIVIRIVTQTRDCKWYRRHRGDNQPPPAGAPIIRVSCLDQQISFDNLLLYDVLVLKLDVCFLLPIWILF